MARGKIEKRGQRRRKIKPVTLIVTEGSQTEPKYLNTTATVGQTSIFVWSAAAPAEVKQITSA